MRIDTIVVGPLGVNCYILSEGGSAVIVDPGGDAAEIVRFLESNGLKPAAIVNTHGHFDHIGAIDELMKKYDIPFYIHRDDEFLVGHGAQTAMMFGAPEQVNPSVTNYLEDGQELEIGGVRMKILHTPGHSPGGVSIYLEEISSVITGDTLFLESIGRSDFPYASHDQLIGGIKSKLAVLPDDTKVYPGHGPESSIGHEMKYNPFL